MVASRAWCAASRWRRLAEGPIVRVAGLRVVSVGALVAGGAGRTPVAMDIAARLRDSGEAVAIVLRGYRGSQSREGKLVSDGVCVLASADEAGDEALLAATRLPGVLVRIGADRVEAARRAQSDGAGVVVLDDGFQHRRLARDVDVVCIDGAPHVDDVVIHREHDRALSRATHLAVRGGGPSDDPRVAAFDLVPEAIVTAGTEGRSAPLSSLAGRRVLAACAIARPGRFRRSLEGLGASVVDFVTARDHSRVADRARRALRGRGDVEVVVTTEKDLVREPDAWRSLGAVALGMRVEWRTCPSFYRSSQTNVSGSSSMPGG